MATCCIAQVHNWERMRMAIPYIAMEINAQRDKYRVLRDNILMVVRDYNKILSSLDKVWTRHDAHSLVYIHRYIGIHT